MNILLLTVAGLSTRFGKSVGHECLKCLYYETDYRESLLWQAVNKNYAFDKIIIVGGYRFEELQQFVGKYCGNLSDKIVLAENEKYAEFGSGYSLYCGLKRALEFSPDRILFAEGDLWVDDKSFDILSNTDRDCLTCNSEPIEADKSVVFYFNESGDVKYLYDTSHNLLEIKEPFVSIYNSGQMWKFCDPEAVCRAFYGLTDVEWQGTNLVFIQKYFSLRERSSYDVVPIKQWINCNTVNDFRKIGECKNEKS